MPVPASLSAEDRGGKPQGRNAREICGNPGPEQLNHGGRPGSRSDPVIGKLLPINGMPENSANFRRMSEVANIVGVWN
jgi:hypothetical protein